MRSGSPWIQTAAAERTPEVFARQLRGLGGVLLLNSGRAPGGAGSYAIVTAEPFLRFRSWGALCEIHCEGRRIRRFGNPWWALDELMARYELPDQPDFPFPLGGCFGLWGYDLKNFVEPRLSRRAVNDLELPDCDLGFYDSLVVFDHGSNRVEIVATGLQTDGSRSAAAAEEQAARWRRRLEESTQVHAEPESGRPAGSGAGPDLESSLARGAFLRAVERAQDYIRAGDIYQVNLSYRLSARWSVDAWRFYERLAAVSPAPFAAWYDAGDYQVASASPELFLRLSGRHVLTRPIKGTRPRDVDPTRDAQLAFELQTSPKEIAELVMITDLLRNDLGRVCEYGSVHVPDLMRLERFAQVQHLVSTVEGRLRSGVSHFRALQACFPGGSITGAPKIRAMEIIDELEPVARGPYTGALGYLGFNRESQLAIAIRTALIRAGRVYFHTGAGIVADSDPAAEYEETLAKARAFLHLAAPHRAHHLAP